MTGRFALVVATYTFNDPGLRQLTAPVNDAEAFAEVLADPAIGGFEVTTLINQPHHVVGAAIGDFFSDRRRDDLTLLYFSGHGLKDDAGKLYLAMTDTRTLTPLFTSVAADQIDYAMTGCHSNHQVLILDCCYSGAFPVGTIAKADDQVHALETFSGRGRTVLTASDATQFAFEGETPHGQATQSVFTRHLVAGLRDGGADLDQDGDITVDELYSYVHDHVVAERPRQRPKKQDNIEGRTVLARNRNWQVPQHIRTALESPAVRDRRNALEDLDQLHRTGGAIVRSRIHDAITRLVNDDSRAIAAAAASWLDSHPTGTPTSSASGSGTAVKPDSQQVREIIPAKTPESSKDAVQHEDSPATDQAPPHPDPAETSPPTEPPGPSENERTTEPATLFDEPRPRRRLRDRKWAIPMTAASVTIACVVAVGGWHLASTDVAGHPIGDHTALRGPDIDLLKLIDSSGRHRSNCYHEDPDPGQTAHIACGAIKAAGAPFARFFRFATGDKLADYFQKISLTMHTGNCPGDPPGPDAPIFDNLHKLVGHKTCARNPSVNPAASVLAVTDEPDLAMAIFSYLPSDWTSPLAEQLRDYRAARGDRQFLAPDEANDPDVFTAADEDLLPLLGRDFTRVNCRHADPANPAKAEIDCATPVNYPTAGFLSYPTDDVATSMYQLTIDIHSGHACDGRPGQDSVWTRNNQTIGRFSCFPLPGDPIHPDDHRPCLLAIRNSYPMVSQYCAMPAGAPPPEITTEPDLLAWFQKWAV
ncbi:caspase family protein [Nocardia tengchongensis]|uniref:caspase family protein n=1 Tax=Nocardia tengchongensis TaxID=2055889 RepID=UPI003684D13F